MLCVAPLHPKNQFLRASYQIRLVHPFLPQWTISPPLPLPLGEGIRGLLKRVWYSDRCYTSAHYWRYRIFILSIKPTLKKRRSLFWGQIINGGVEAYSG